MKYFIENDTLYELSVFDWEYPDDPCMDNLVTTMCIWWNRYSLGDYEEVGRRSPVEYLTDLIEERLPEANTYNKSPVELLELLCTDPDIAVMPLYIYEHGGMTISTSDIPNPYGHWDSGMCGFIWTDKAKYEGFFGETDDWKNEALNLMRSEVDEYDMYLQGEAYITEIVPYDIDESDFDDLDCETVDYFFSNNYGDGLLHEATERIDVNKVYDSFDEALEAYKKQLVKSGRVFDSLRLA